jgi:hypothetical protein
MRQGRRGQPAANFDSKPSLAREPGLRASAGGRSMSAPNRDKDTSDERHAPTLLVATDGSDPALAGATTSGGGVAGGGERPRGRGPRSRGPTLRR